jgi:hypothetical protein
LEDVDPFTNIEIYLLLIIKDLRLPRKCVKGVHIFHNIFQHLPRKTWVFLHSRICVRENDWLSASQPASQQASQPASSQQASQQVSKPASQPGQPASQASTHTHTHTHERTRTSAHAHAQAHARTGKHKFHTPWVLEQTSSTRLGYCPPAIGKRRIKKTNRKAS